LLRGGKGGAWRRERRGTLKKEHPATAHPGRKERGGNEVAEALRGGEKEKYVNSASVSVLGGKAYQASKMNMRYGKRVC